MYCGTPTFWQRGLWDSCFQNPSESSDLHDLFCLQYSISKHFTEQNILSELQHGFREKRSCETQLIMLVDELSKSMQSGKQTGLILLDFSKAFDKVAHEKFILSKLHFYGIRGNILNWIKDFLDNRTQSVILNGT